MANCLFLTLIWIYHTHNAIFAPHETYLIIFLLPFETPSNHSLPTGKELVETILERGDMQFFLVATHRWSQQRAIIAVILFLLFFKWRLPYLSRFQEMEAKWKIDGGLYSFHVCFWSGMMLFVHVWTRLQKLILQQKMVCGLF